MPVTVDPMLVVPRLSEATDSRQGRLRFLLVDRRPLFLAALAELIRAASPSATIDITTDSARALSTASQHRIDLLFCEARALPLSGAQVAAGIRQRGLRTPIVLIGEPDDQQFLLSRLSCGANGFFTKDAAPEAFLEGMEAVLAGHFVLARELLPPALQGLAATRPTEARAQVGKLSPTERDILAMIAEAQPTRQIAANRGVGEKTVRNHLASIYRKLGLRNRSEAIVWAARAELGAD